METESGEWTGSKAAERKQAERGGRQRREGGRVEGARIKHPSPLGDVLTGRKRPPREEGGRKGGKKGGIGRVKTGG